MRTPASTVNAGRPAMDSGGAARAAARFDADAVFRAITLAASCAVPLVLAWIGVRLALDSALTRHVFGWAFLSGRTWDVPHAVYGALPYVFGTAVTTAGSILIAAPLGIGAAVFLSELAPSWVEAPVSFVVELLAAVPSVIFGLWGFLVLCPFLHEHVSPLLARSLGGYALFAGPPVPTNTLAACTVLSLMLLPTVTAISRDVLRSIPRDQRDGSLALGATRWETIRLVVLPAARRGIAGAVVLGMGRAIGETMAVVMVIGNTPRIGASLLEPAYTMPALLANQFNEAFNDPLQRSALLEIALILFVITLAVNGTARVVLLRRQPSGGAAAGPLARIGRWAIPAAGAAAALAILVAGLRAGGTTAVTVLVLTALAVAGAIGPRLAARAGRLSGYRRWAGRAGEASCALCAAAVGGAVLAVLLYVFTRGVPGINRALFTQLPRPPGMEGGGLRNAIIGTVQLVGLASALGIPVGILSGIYLAEYGRGRIGAAIRYAADVLVAVPSVVVGMFAYGAMVLPFGRFSLLAGGVALAVMIVPVVLRTTEEMLRLVPETLRDAAMALGATRPRAILTVVLPAARAGVATGLLLGVARIAGETAPLLFTAFGNGQVATHLMEPVSSLTMMIYQYAESPYNDWVQQAWSGALVLLALVSALVAAARICTASRVRTRAH